MPRNAEILIYDEIASYAVTAADVSNSLKAQRPFDSLDVRFNSPGGHVFEAQAIYTNLVRVSETAEVNCHIDGLCASAATFIAMAGDTLTMAENAAMMIHKPWSIVLGDAEDMRSVAGRLDALEDVMVRQYAGRTGLEPEAIKAMLAAETWFSAEKALEAGFITAIEETMPIAACVGKLEIPEHIRDRLTIVDRSTELKELVAKQVALSEQG